MLLNVRLGPEEQRMVRGLRRAKVNVSALVRKAIRDAAVLADAPGKARAQRLQAILEAHPDGEEPRPRRPALDDRLAMQRHVARAMKRKRT